ncbi:4Fe-4S dicluster domain-containing protein [bacterium]|nr:4Fe-4S dicluster domain-containing protein [bacterium]MBU1874195.1 4Fe-4S dicluster domain-containing protein [bacterium]
MIVKAQDFTSFLIKCQQESLGGFQQVIVPRKSNNSEDKQYLFEELKQGAEPVLDAFRTVDPLRVLFYFSRETLIPVDKTKKRLIVGAKGCDMAALQILDKALINNDFIDPVYKAWRDQTTIISTDCTEISDSCHCNLVGGKPYTDQNYDMNLSKVGQSYLITVGSKKGEEFVKLLKENVQLTQPQGDEKDKIKKNRKSIEARLNQHNAKYNRSDNYSVLRKSDIEGWLDDVKNCVGCGGCTNICPTCYCIIVNDETTGKEFVKVRSADSCQLHGYAKVAGGDSPRHKMYQRFRNRYLCKFDYMKSNFDTIGCTGCGRCIDVCAGEIEFREVVQKQMQLPKAQE